MKQSQTNFLLFGIVNGASYMCLGETVIILFAVRLDMSNSLIAVIGSMLYFGYLLLPLGKWMTARGGAVQSQADFWLLRNFAALLVALAAPASLYWNQTGAILLLLSGAFFFYGFRAAGSVMSQPLIGEICEPARRGKIISQYNTLFHVFGLLSLVSISLLLKYHSSIWVLFGVIITGSVLGCCSTWFFRRICETGLIRDSARLPVKSMLAKAYENTFVRRQLVAGSLCNLTLILTLPMSILTVKKGHGFSDTQALLCTLLQFAVMIGGSYLQTRVSDKMGAKNMLTMGYVCSALICLSWLLMPVDVHPFWLCIPFFFCGFASITINNGIIFYFLMSIPKELQVVASMLISVATGVLAGITGMLAGSMLLKAAEKVSSHFGQFGTFQCYFGMVLLIILLCSIFIFRLPQCHVEQVDDD